MAIDWTAVSPLVIPEIANTFRSGTASIPTSLNSLQSMVQGGINSPLLQQVLGPMLERLQAPQAQQRQNLTESTRAAGGLRGSTYSQDMNKLQQNQGQQTNDLMGQVLQQILAPLIQGQLQEQRNQFLPADAYANLLGSVKPTVLSGGQGGNAGAGGSGGSNFLAGTDPFNAANDPYFQNALGNVSPANQLFGGGTGTLGGQNTAPQPLGMPAAPGTIGPPPTIPYQGLFDGGSGGNYGGGSYDLGFGAGTQYLNSPAASNQPQTGHPYTHETTYPGLAPGQNPYDFTNLSSFFGYDNYSD